MLCLFTINVFQELLLKSMGKKKKKQNYVIVEKKIANVYSKFASERVSCINLTKLVEVGLKDTQRIEERRKSGFFYRYIASLMIFSFFNGVRIVFFLLSIE